MNEGVNAATKLILSLALYLLYAVALYCPVCIVIVSVGVLTLSCLYIH